VPRRPAAAPPRQAEVLRNRAVIEDLRARERVKIVPGQIDWRQVDGTRYCHYYDAGAHWYGFYGGSHFYWTRYWADRWWWHDPYYARWLFWSGGYWWYPAPTGLVVYVDNAYYPYEQARVSAPKPEPPPTTPSGAPPPVVPASGGAWNSPDGRRMVQISGARGEAFLYDTTGKEPAFLSYLGEGVEKARFSGGAKREPLRILLDLKDGSFTLLDADGKPLENARKVR
jgi:hypothetical protein